MKKLFLLAVIITPLMGCSASIGPPATTTVATTPAVTTTHYTAPVATTTVARTTY